MAKLSRKKENVFLRLLREQAAQVREGVTALESLVTDGDPEAAAVVRRCEKDADELRRILIDELHKTFVTPFDREDIFNLSLYLDDVLDYAYTTVKELRELEVTPDEHLQRMVTRVREAGEELELAMGRIDDNPMVALDHARRVKHRENQVETEYRRALVELFSGPEDLHHIMEIMKVREVYRHVSNAADQADLAANVIGSVVVKMT